MAGLFASVSAKNLRIFIFRTVLVVFCFFLFQLFFPTKRLRHYLPVGREYIVLESLIYSMPCRPEDLRGPFGQFGPLKDIYLPRDYYTG